MPLTPSTAQTILKLAGCTTETDFYTLSSSQVDNLLKSADAQKYRKPKNANGSRVRYFFAHIQRAARKDA